MMKNYKKFWWFGMIKILMIWNDYDKKLWINHLKFYKYKFTIGLFEFIN